MRGIALVLLLLAAAPPTARTQMVDRNCPPDQLSSGAALIEASCCGSGSAGCGGAVPTSCGRDCAAAFEPWWSSCGSRLAALEVAVFAPFALRCDAAAAYRNWQSVLTAYVSPAAIGGATVDCLHHYYYTDCTVPHYCTMRGR
jgi:hypothetical protein